MLFRSRVSGNGKKSGNTATWENAHEETEALTAEGSDHASSRNAGDDDHASSGNTGDTYTDSSTPIIIIIVLVLAAIGGVAAFIIIRQKRAKAGAPEYPQPGQQPYTPSRATASPHRPPPPAPPSRVTTLSPTHSSPTTHNRATAASRETVGSTAPTSSPDRLTAPHPNLDASARTASMYRTFSPGVEAVDPWSATPDQYSPGVFLRPRSPVG